MSECKHLEEDLKPRYISDGDHVFIGASICGFEVQKITVVKGVYNSEIIAELTDGDLLIGGITDGMVTVGCIAISRLAFENIRKAG